MTEPRGAMFKLRHSAGALLNASPRVKRLVKRAYYWAHDPFGRGCPLEVGGVTLRVPPRFAEPPWTNYELPSTREVAAWLESRPDAILLDVGASVGVYSALTLARSARTEAYAFDSDLVSLKSTTWLCRHIGTDRLHCIHGLVADCNESGLTYQTAAARTAVALASPSVSSDPELASYVCIDGQEHPNTPTHSIDGLFAHAPTGRPWLIKCDVEGAELLVLRGLSTFARLHRPQLLVSVHAALHGFGFTSVDVVNWMRGHRYSYRILSVDHEEHWWCTPDVT